MTKIHTIELIDLLFSNPNHTIEASLNDGRFNATHFFILGRRKLFDCGIDSATVSWNIQEFLTFYLSVMTFHWNVITDSW